MRLPSQSAKCIWPNGQERLNNCSSALPSAPVASGSGAMRGLSSPMRWMSSLQGGDALHLEADVIHALGDDARAVVIGDVPRHDHQRDVAVGQIMILVACALVGRRQLEHVAVELGHGRGVHRAERDVMNMARIGVAVVLDVDRRAVRHVLLRNVEHVAVGIVRRDAGEGAGRGALQPFHLRVALAHPLVDGLCVLHLDAEMIEARRAARAARVDVQANVSVAHRHGARGARARRRAHAEHSLVELGELGVVFADDGDVVDLRESHDFPPVRRGPLRARH